jgi:hypothetical protein
MTGAPLKFIVVEIERTPEPVCADPFIVGLEREAESAIGRRGRRRVCTDDPASPRRSLPPSRAGRTPVGRKP